MLDCGFTILPTDVDRRAAREADHERLCLAGGVALNCAMNARRRAGTTAESLVPPGADLEGLRAAAARCRACGLWKRATRTVFGEGSEGARFVLVGEQPGDAEDKAGHPFVGPSGRLLDEALTSAGIDRSAAYVTNAVKHFKWTPRGGRRIHEKPNRAERDACNPWLRAELERIHPDVIVCLGATAAQSVIDPDFRVTKDHGKTFETAHGAAVATIHPSAVLRAPEEEARRALLRQMVADLRAARAAANSRRVRGQVAANAANGSNRD